MGVEQSLPVDGHAARDADDTDAAAGACGAQRLAEGLSGADTLQDGIGTDPVGEVLDAGHAVVAPLGDDVGGAELEGEFLAGLVPAHRDDPLRAELPGGEHAEQTDGTVTDDSHGRARLNARGDGGEPAGAEHVGGGQQAGQQLVVGHLRGGDERGVGEWDPQRFGLCAARADELTVLARGLVAGSTMRAGVVRGEEAADDELAGLDRRHVVADIFDDAAVLVLDRGGAGDGVMCHVAMLEGTGDSDGTTWLEPVTEQQYEQANRD